MRTFLDHVLDNGGTYVIDSVPVMCDLHPITLDALSPSEKYYIVRLTLTGYDYLYLIPAKNRLQPDEETIGLTIRAYAKNPVPGGRDWFTCIDTNHPQSKKNEMVQAKMQELGVDPTTTTKPSGTPSPKFSLDDYL